MTKYTLVIGDYSKSSWSMRGWLVLKALNIPFDVIKVRLREPETTSNILKYSPSGKLPALIMNNLVVNDSLAIADTLAETYPKAKLWPDNPGMRAKARSAVAEMHAGFVSLRTQMPFGVSVGERVDLIQEKTLWEIERIFQIWRDLKMISGSSAFLCGDFGIVDAAFAPVIFRFRRFGIDIPADLKSYQKTLLSYAPIEEWLMLARKELEDSGEPLRY